MIKANIIKFSFGLLKTLLALFALVSAFWCAGALFYLLYDIEWTRTIVPYAFLALWTVLFLVFANTARVYLAYLVTVTLIFCVWFFQPASNDRDWLPEYARLTHVERQNNKYIFYNIRDFTYHGSRDNFTQRYLKASYDPEDIEGVDFVLSYWDDQTMIAHVMMVFKFADARNLVLSAETRREKDEPWDIPRGFFNQYEMIYLIGTERDLIGRRITVSNEDVFLYPAAVGHAEAKVLFTNMVNELNSLYVTPRFYNTLVHNCTSFLFDVVRRPDLFAWFNPALILNGVSDRYLREVGVIEGEGSYWEFKMQHYISPQVKALDEPYEVDFSSLIRKHLIKN